VKVAVVQFGFKEVTRNFEQMGRDAKSIHRALDLVVDAITEVEEAMFNSQGRRGGGSWRRVTQAWQRRKLRHGWDPRTGHARHLLRKSVTYRGDPNMVVRIDPVQGTIIFGSRLPYASVQQRNRPYLRFTIHDRRKFAKIIINDLTEKFKRRARRRTV